MRKLPDACEAVGKILASGITPLVTEIMDHDVMRAIDTCSAVAGRPPTFSLDADALLLVAVDGDPDAVERDIEVIAGRAAQIRRDERAAGAQRRRSRSVVGDSPLGVAGDHSAGQFAFRRRHRRAARTDSADGRRWSSRSRKKYDLTIAVFGHIGDGNLHPNIVCDRRDAEMMKRVEAASHAIFDAAIELGGAISGEHGIGLLKTGYVPKSVDPIALEMMRQVKKLFDPNNIMNPGKKIGVRDAVTW